MKKFIKIMMCMVVFMTTMPSILFAEVTPTDISALDYAIYAQTVTAKAGEEISLSVRLKNVNAIATWQADLILPEGVSIATDQYDDPLVVLSNERTTTSRHSVSTRVLSDGSIRILCSSSSNKTFSGTDGETVIITLNISDTIKGGDYAISFKDEIMAESNETGHKVDMVISLLKIEDDQDTIRLDINGDGEVTIADVTYLVNFILNKE